MKNSGRRVNGLNSLRMPRSRDAVTGLLLVLLGAWGALIPFVGPYFDFAYTPDQPWTWTAARGWLEVFPGVTTFLGGWLLLVSGNRATAMFGGWLAVFAGAWFVVGCTLATTLGLGDIGHPVASTDAKRAVLEISYFSGLGALIVFLGGAILARLSVRLARDVEASPGSVSDVSSADVVPTQVSPDAITQSRLDQFAAPSPEPQRSRGGIFRRRRASA